MLKRLFLIGLVLLLCVSFAHAQSAQLWETGQTTSYGTMDDGNLKRGVAWPSPRFTDNGNGTVTDSLTGLIWLKNANCFGGKTWAQALSDANNLANGQCSLTDGSSAGDWRLPNRKELRSLIDYSQYNPALPTGHPFSNVQAHYYWSSTTGADGTGSAWYVDMWDGDVYNVYKDGSSYVWPVRAGSGLFYNLNISRIGAGTGTVTSSPAGIDCGGDCDQVYDKGTVVTLTAEADTGSTFAGWSGDCSSCGTNTSCDITMNANKTCTATFALSKADQTISWSNPADIVYGTALNGT